MKDKINICAVIPARSGSKSIKNKNIINLCGHPILAYSIDIAVKSKIFDKVIFSSDAKKYLNIAKKYNPDYLHKRSKKNSSSLATDLDYLTEILDYLKYEHSYKPDLIALLRADNPTRNMKELVRAIKFFKKNYKKYSSLRSVNLTSENSYKTFTVSNYKLKTLISNSFNVEKSNIPKQLLKNTYAANGFLDIIKTNQIQKNHLHGNKVYALKVKNFSLDIDNQDDLQYSKFLINQKKYHKIKLK